VLAHLRVHGAKNWKAVRERHQSVPARSWWRLVRRAKAALPALRNREVATAFATAVELSKLKPASAISVPPPAALRHADKDEAVDLMRELRGLIADCDALRDFSLNPADDKGDRKIRNAMYFSKSVALRRDLAETMLKCWEQMFDVRAMQQFYDIVVEEVGRASPDVQAAIMERLHSLNQDRGFSFGG
jgi:hypothetical protein